MCEVNCPYKNKCSSYPTFCGSCRHNTSKRDYYEPDYPDYWRPVYPWPWPYWETHGTDWTTPTDVRVWIC